MTPPTMAAWNLGLRFGLELAALAGLAVAAWKWTPAPTRWFTAVAVPLAAAALWGTFNVLNDPSRSGEAPIEVSGVTRLAIELVILGGGAAAIALAGRRDFGVMFAVLVGFHYLSSLSRIGWLLES